MTCAICGSVGIVGLLSHSRLRWHRTEACSIDCRPQSLQGPKPIESGAITSGLKPGPPKELQFLGSLNPLACIGCQLDVVE
jgi:hypothetical protein